MSPYAGIYTTPAPATLTPSDLQPEPPHPDLGRATQYSRADDDHVWHYACSNGYVLVSKDTDFLHRALMDTAGGKFVYLRTGNCTSARVAKLLTSRSTELLAFGADPAATVLTLE